VKALLYSRVFPPATGGMERFAEDVAEWLAITGHEVTVVTRKNDHDAADGARPYRVLRGPSAGELRRVLRWADVVHVNGLSIRGIAASILARRPCVVTHAGHQAVCPTGLAWTEQGCGAGPPRGPCRACPARTVVGWAKVATHRRAAQRAQANICVSHYLADRLDLPASKAIYNPVANRAFAARAQGNSQVGLLVFAGRLVAEKGLDLLLRALALVPEAALDIVGEGPMRKPWQVLTEELGLAHRVRFCGASGFEGVAEAYARAAAVCVPSLWEEPFGYAAAEAMGMGRAVVATPRGALPELLDERRGFIAEEATPAALARVLEQTLGDDAARRESGVRAREFARRELAIDTVGPKYLAVYEKAMA
jgi:glycosyltransferase involved in cell wall biosynthesis